LKQWGIIIFYIGIKKQKRERNNTENNGRNVITNFTRILNCSLRKLGIKHFLIEKNTAFCILLSSSSST